MSKTNNSSYFKIESLSGALLIFCASFGFVLNNSPLEAYYDQFVQFPIQLMFGSFSFTQPVVFWVNEGLLSVFFLFIGLEIKSLLFTEQEIAHNQLILPVSGAIAGAIVPAIVYTIFNHDNLINMRGWAIPTAMDTAFIIGILALLGKKIPSSLRLFVMLLSIIDDILAVLIISVFYAGKLAPIPILLATIIIGILLIINKARVLKTTPYILLGLALWIAVLGSGIHTSIAGILLACTIPIKKEHKQFDLLNTMKNYLHPVVGFVILPVFAFVNTGIDLRDISVKQLYEPLALGIMLGLFLGKQIGIFGITYVLHKLKICKLPHHTSWWQIYGISILCGVGFTMSLFISVLAFGNEVSNIDDIVKAAIFIASIVSAILGYTILRLKS